MIIESYRLRTQQRIAPDAKVVSSNLAWSANHFGAVYLCASKSTGEALGKHRNGSRPPIADGISCDSCYSCCQDVPAPKRRVRPRILLHAGAGWQKIAMLQRGGHDVAAAKSLLSQLKAGKHGTLSIGIDCSKNWLTVRSCQPPQHTMASLGLSPIVTHLISIVTHLSQISTLEPLAR